MAFSCSSKVSAAWAPTCESRNATPTCGTFRGARESLTDFIVNQVNYLTQDARRGQIANDRFGWMREKTSRTTFLTVGAVYEGVNQLRDQDKPRSNQSRADGVVVQTPLIKR